jgi:NAD(P)-dependent dehydrogenase (short-subunit alcohol dehydrogenase family)
MGGKVDPSSDVEDRLATGDPRQTKEKRVALVTGAASGLGRAIALALKKDGFFVFRTSRHSTEPSVPPDFPILQLDVRSDDSVRSALETVRSLTGRLDVLVNNAGFRFLGAAEETTVDEAKAVFETNFFGAHRVTAAALPLLRATHASKIINITSLSGLNALPFGSIYSASKWALEAYSESLRHEVKSLGISVSIVEPGAILSEKREPPHRPKETAQTYETARQHALDVIVGGDRTGIDATRVADCVIRVVHSRSPRLRYRVGADATWLPRLKLLPWSWYERAIRWRYRLDV